MNKLREAAQAVLDTVDIHGVYRPEIFEAFERLRDALREDALVCLSETHQQLNAALEYELWGIIMGSPGGRWVTSQVDTHKIYPVGTALWVKVGEKK